MPAATAPPVLPEPVGVAEVEVPVVEAVEPVDPVPYECPVPVIRGSPPCALPNARVVARLFSRLARGESVDAMVYAFGDPAVLRDRIDSSRVLPRAAATHACPLWWDGRSVALDDPELGVLPMEVHGCADGEPHRSERGLVDTFDAEWTYSRRVATRALHAWLDAHPSARISEAADFPLELFLLRETDHTIACVVSTLYETPDVPEAGRCFRITPPIRTATAWGRVVTEGPPPADDEAEDTRQSRVTTVFVVLDGQTFRLAPRGLVRAHPAARTLFAFAGRAPMRTTHARLRIEATDAGELPPFDVLDRLRPREIGDTCLEGDVLCCFIDARWRCADDDTETDRGSTHVDSVAVEGGQLSLVATHGLGTSGRGYHWHEEHDFVQLFVADGDRLVENGALETAYEYCDEQVTEDFDEEDDAARLPWEGTITRVEWTVAVRAPACVEYLSVTRTTTTEQGEGARTHEETQVAVPELSSAPSTIEDAVDHGERTFGSRDFLVHHGGIADRRGLWHLDDGTWSRVDRCPDVPRG